MLKNLNALKNNNPIKNLHLSAQMKKLKLHDMGIAAAFVGAIAVLLIVAVYVTNRLASDRAHRAKWQDYNDCGWA